MASTSHISFFYLYWSFRSTLNILYLHSSRNQKYFYSNVQYSLPLHILFSTWEGILQEVPCIEQHAVDLGFVFCVQYIQGISVWAPSGTNCCRRTACLPSLTLSLLVSLHRCTAWLPTHIRMSYWHIKSHIGSVCVNLRVDPSPSAHPCRRPRWAINFEKQAK